MLKHSSLQEVGTIVGAGMNSYLCYKLQESEDMPVHTMLFEGKP